MRGILLVLLLLGCLVNAADCMRPIIVPCGKCGGADIIGEMSAIFHECKPKGNGNNVAAGGQRVRPKKITY